MKFEESMEHGFHKSLLQLEGHWEGTNRVWFEPGNPIDTAQITGKMSSVLGGRFLEWQYDTAFQSTAIEGKMLFGLYLKLNKYELTWVDTFHTGTFMMYASGIAEGDIFNATGHYVAGENNEQTWGWRTTLEIISNNEIIIRAYNITPEGEEQLALQYDLKRS
jgi:hypothetical protein